MVGVLEMTTVTGVCLDIETGLNVAEACLDGLLDTSLPITGLISRHFTGPFFSKRTTWVIFFQMTQVGHFFPNDPGVWKIMTKVFGKK